MYLCLHQSIAPITDGEAFMRLAAKYGFAGGDNRAQVWTDWVERTSLANVADVCAALNCKIAHCGIPVFFREDEQAFEDTMKLFPMRAEIISELGIKTMSSSIPPATRGDAVEMMGILKRRLKRINEVAEDHGVRIGLEYVAVPSARAGMNPMVHTLEDTLDLCADIGENAGVLIDSYHWYCAEETVADLLDLSPGSVVHVHINDAQAGDIDLLQDKERLLPGAGVIDLPGFLGALKRVGYDGPVSVECFSASLEAAGADEAAKLAMRTGKAALEKMI